MRLTTTTADSVVPNRPIGDGFSVSTTTGTGIDGAVLNVRRTRWVSPELAQRLHQRGAALSMVLERPLDGLVQILTPCDGDGLLFPSTDAAGEYALERGYKQRYVTSPDLRARRIQRAATQPTPTHERRTA